LHGVNGNAALAFWWRAVSIAQQMPGFAVAVVPIAFVVGADLDGDSLESDCGRDDVPDVSWDEVKSEEVEFGLLVTATTQVDVTT
jgi:hypothetical protein